MDYVLFGLIAVAAIANGVTAWYLSQTRRALRSVQAELSQLRPSPEDIQRTRDMIAFFRKRRPSVGPAMDVEEGGGA